MISVAPPALHHALQLLRTPTGARPGAHERLPEGMLLLIRIVAGDELALAEARQRSEEPGEVVREAAAFYIQQVMFASGSHSYRLLGVDADAPDERIKEHYRWLVRWLHPDRNADEWEVVYADRVNRAWQDLRTPSRRQRYDDLRAAEAVVAGTNDARTRSTGEHPVASLRTSQAAAPSYDDSAAGYDALRWLPKLIFGGLGVSAVLALGLLWLLRAPSPEVDTHRVAAAAEDVPVATERAPAEPPAEAITAAATPTIELQPTAPEPAPAEAEAAVPDLNPAATSPDPVASAIPAAAPAPAKPVVPASPLAKQAPAPSRAAPARTEPSIAATMTLRKPAPSVVAAGRDSRRTGAPAPAPAVSTVAQEAPVAIASARRDTPEAEPGLPAIDDRIANRLVGQLSQAYGDGDLQRMRSLVTSNATGGSGDLLDEYDRLFASSEQRSLSISNVSWLQDGDNATIIATYVATVQARAGKRPRRSGGDMRLDLRVEGGQWRIYRLSHDDRRG